MALDRAELDVEREMQGRADQLAILRHAERLKVLCGRERAIRALEAALQELSSHQLYLDECLGK
jgi:hypothetical protein